MTFTGTNHHDDTTELQTDVLVVGAGPFGLALAAHLKALGCDAMLVGRPMEFWSANMPDGMVLRSASDWHLDPEGSATIERFLATRGLTPAQAEPLSLQLYLDYVDWFMGQKALAPDPTYVERLDRLDGPTPAYRATLEDGRVILAQRVVLALGFRHFEHPGPDLLASLPPDVVTHTCDYVDFSEAAGRRFLIVGGRQSAFEWAALLNEAGAAAVHLVHRHASPAFAEADWSWVTPIVEHMSGDPGWFRNLPAAEQETVTRRLWGEGRLKVEPWLESRVAGDTVRIWPEASIVAAGTTSSGALEVELDTGPELTIDRIVLATGYKVDIRALPLLARGNVLPQLEVRDGFPVLDEGFQTSVPGLYITSMAATRDFGPFFAFTVSARTSARIIGRDLQRSTQPRAADTVTPPARWRL